MFGTETESFPTIHNFYGPEYKSFEKQKEISEKINEYLFCLWCKEKKKVFFCQFWTCVFGKPVNHTVFVITGKLIAPAFLWFLACFHWGCTEHDHKQNLSWRVFANFVLQSKWCKWSEHRSWNFDKILNYLSTSCGGCSRWQINFLGKVFHDGRERPLMCC